MTVFESGSGTDGADLIFPGNTGAVFTYTPAVSTLVMSTETITINSFIENSNQQIVAVPSLIGVIGNNPSGSPNAADTASLYDGPGSNALVASLGEVTLTTAVGGSVTLQQFGSVTAYQQNGTNDTVHEDSIDFACS